MYMYTIAAHLDRNAIIHDIKVFFNFFPSIFSVGHKMQNFVQKNMII